MGEMIKKYEMKIWKGSNKNDIWGGRKKKYEGLDP